MTGRAADGLERKRTPLHLCAEVLALRPLIRCRNLSFCCGRHGVGEILEHRHDQLEISLVFNGARCAYSWPWKGRREERLLSGPAALMIAPQQWHACRWEKEADAINLYLERRLHRELLPEGLEDFVSAVPVVSHDRMLWSFASSLRDLSVAQNPARAKMLHLVAETVARRVVELLGQGAVDALRRLPVEVMLKIDEFVWSQLAYPIQTKDLARIASLSVPYFVTLFKATKGRTPAEFILECRMNRADELLRTGKYTIRKAAQMVGYWDAGNFAEKFAEFHGYSPKQAIQQGRAESSDRPRIQ